MVSLYISSLSPLPCPLELTFEAHLIKDAAHVQQSGPSSSLTSDCLISAPNWRFDTSCHVACGTESRLTLTRRGRVHIQSLNPWCAWCVHGVCMACVWHVHGVCMECIWSAHGVTLPPGCQDAPPRCQGPRSGAPCEQASSSWAPLGLRVLRALLSWVSILTSFVILSLGLKAALCPRATPLSL